MYVFGQLDMRTLTDKKKNENFDEALSWLRQTGTMPEYQAQFECLENQVEGWPERH